MPVKYQAGGFNLSGLATPIIILAVVLLPVLFRRPAAPPDAPDSGSDDGPGKGPMEPPIGPSFPTGGIPLPDAEPAGVRLRDHTGLAARRRVHRRSPAGHPERKPTRACPRDQVA
ncbi:MAG TPA: hypothetical protein VIX82_06940 [Solirubrobacteraceae bacterium]